MISLTSEFKKQNKWTLGENDRNQILDDKTELAKKSSVNLLWTGIYIGIEKGDHNDYNNGMCTLEDSYINW